MDRREFGSVVGAGVLFPATFVKGLASRADIPCPQSGTHIFCCGSDDNPVTEEQISKLMNFINKGSAPDSWTSIIGIGNDWASVIGYGRSIGAPLSAIYKLDIPLDRLVVGIGSDDRPAQEEDIVDVRNQLLKLPDWKKSYVVTHHNFYPYEFQGCTLHHPPMVRTHQWTEGALRRDMIRRMPVRWHNAFVTEYEF